MIHASAEAAKSTKTAMVQWRNFSKKGPAGMMPVFVFEKGQYDAGFVFEKKMV